MSDIAIEQRLFEALTSSDLTACDKLVSELLSETENEKSNARMTIGNWLLQLEDMRRALSGF
jgi:hypothetical protein